MAKGEVKAAAGTNQWSWGLPDSGTIVHQTMSLLSIVTASDLSVCQQFPSLVTDPAPTASPDHRFLRFPDLPED